MGNSRIYKIALAGNPNSGRTTLFNALTGGAGSVGNYAGVTVEKSRATFKVGGLEIEVTDAPGVYSLNTTGEYSTSPDDILNAAPDIIVNVIDSGNIKRNLLLTSELAELEIPMLIVFNMADEARAKGLRIDYEAVRVFTGIECVECTASKKQGVDELKTMIWKILCGEKKSIPVMPSFGDEADSVIDILAERINLSDKLPYGTMTKQFYARRLIENDEKVCANAYLSTFVPDARECAAQLVTSCNLSHGTFMTELRYEWAEKLITECVVSGRPRDTVSTTDKIDAIVLNRFLGLPIFLVIMFIVFAFTFMGAHPLTELMGDLFGGAADLINDAWPRNWPEFPRMLLTEGIIGGVGGVLVFLPNIVILFLALAILEDTGYMTRAAFVMDGFMHFFGLHGKSFIPMLLGFGCTVPAVMATRTIENERDRKATIFVLPFMSCGARLPIYSMIIPAFFPEMFQALVMWIIYIIGIVVALVGARLLKSTMFRSENDLFILEMPPYRVPSLTNVIRTVRTEAWMYLKKAGSVILIFSIGIFIMSKFPQKFEFSRDYEKEIATIEQSSSTLSTEQMKTALSVLENAKAAEQLEYSAAGRVGKVLAHIFAPLGFDWKVSSSLVGALAAKELFVSQMGILHAAGGDSKKDQGSRLIAAMKDAYTPLQGFVIMIFCLLTLPCIGTISVVYKETKSLRFTILQAVTLTLTAYVMAFLVYRTGLLFGLGTG